jgi:mannose-6-phosphate isomerase
VTAPLRPQVLGANQPRDRFYAGGTRIADFRGEPRVPGNVPEDWVASTTTLFGEASTGLSPLPDGSRLADAVRQAPARWLGPDHVRAFGDDTYLLVKLLDAGQRLPVHAHPDVSFAGEHLSLAHGKTEAWVFLEPAVVHLAFDRDVDAAELAGWVARQDVEGMLGAMHRLPVEPGDAVLVPAGLPHAIGAGAFLVELQEPTDLSILMEWRDFDLDGAALGHLGLGFETALRAVDRRAWSPAAVEDLRGARAADLGALLPAARPWFRVDRVRATGAFDAGFAVAVVVSGAGRLVAGEGDGDDTQLALRRGQTVVVPYAAGPVRFDGGDGFEVLYCRPPLPPGT